LERLRVLLQSATDPVGVDQRAVVAELEHFSDLPDSPAYCSLLVRGDNSSSSPTDASLPILAALLCRNILRRGAQRGGASRYCPPAACAATVSALQLAAFSDDPALRRAAAAAAPAVAACWGLSGEGWALLDAPLSALDGRPVGDAAADGAVRWAAEVCDEASGVLVADASLSGVTGGAGSVPVAAAVAEVLLKALGRPALSPPRGAPGTAAAAADVDGHRTGRAVTAARQAISALWNAGRLAPGPGGGAPPLVTALARALFALATDPRPGARRAACPGLEALVRLPGGPAQLAPHASDLLGWAIGELEGDGETGAGAQHRAGWTAGDDEDAARSAADLLAAWADAAAGATHEAEREALGGVSSVSSSGAENDRGLDGPAWLGALAPLAPRLVAALVGRLRYRSDDDAVFAAEEAEGPERASDAQALGAGRDDSGGDTSGTQGGLLAHDSGPDDPGGDDDAAAMAEMAWGGTDDGGAWTARSAAGAALDCLCAALGSHVLAPTLAVASAWLGFGSGPAADAAGADWSRVEAALLALGAVAPGAAVEMIPHLAPTLAVAARACDHDHPLVRQMACWTVSRLAPLAAGRDLDPSLPAASPEAVEAAGVGALACVAHIGDPNRRVHNAACSSVASLSEDLPFTHRERFESAALTALADFFGRPPDHPKFGGANAVARACDALSGLAEATEADLPSPTAPAPPLWRPDGPGGAALRAAVARWAHEEATSTTSEEGAGSALLAYPLGEVIAMCCGVAGRAGGALCPGASGDSPGAETCHTVARLAASRVRAAAEPAAAWRAARYAELRATGLDAEAAATALVARHPECPSLQQAGAAAVALDLLGSLAHASPHAAAAVVVALVAIRPDAVDGWCASPVLQCASCAHSPSLRRSTWACIGEVVGRGGRAGASVVGLDGPDARLPPLARAALCQLGSLGDEESRARSLALLRLGDGAARDAAANVMWALGEATAASVHECNGGVVGTRSLFAAHAGSAGGMALMTPGTLPWLEAAAPTLTEAAWSLLVNDGLGQAGSPLRQNAATLLGRLCLACPTAALPFAPHICPPLANLVGRGLRAGAGGRELAEATCGLVALVALAPDVALPDAPALHAFFEAVGGWGADPPPKGWGEAICFLGVAPNLALNGLRTALGPERWTSWCESAPAAAKAGLARCFAFYDRM